MAVGLFRVRRRIKRSSLDGVFYGLPEPRCWHQTHGECSSATIAALLQLNSLVIRLIDQPAFRKAKIVSVSLSLSK